MCELYLQITSSSEAVSADWKFNLQIPVAVGRNVVDMWNATITAEESDLLQALNKLWNLYRSNIGKVEDAQQVSVLGFFLATLGDEVKEVKGTSE